VTVQIHYNCFSATMVFRCPLPTLAVALASTNLKVPVSRLVYEQVPRAASGWKNIVAGGGLSLRGGKTGI
jgi:hypothetical protein